MQFTVLKPTDIDVRYVKVHANVRNGDESMPHDLPGRNGDHWFATIDLETGAIADWRQGYRASLCLKVCDAGTYALLDADENELAYLGNDYVPHGVIPGSYGDYIEIDVDCDGRIVDWDSSKIDISAFFPQEAE